MFGVFVAFVFAADPAIKAIGFTLAVGVLFDAFIVRLTLVPAAMAILGSRLWYHPQWFARLVPDADIEGQRLERELASSAA
jgi:RND superfamily putative drug exporter